MRQLVHALRPKRFSARGIRIELELQVREKTALDTAAHEERKSVQRA
jgi:hypothetical protein